MNVISICILLRCALQCGAVHCSASINGWYIFCTMASQLWTEQDVSQLVALRVMVRQLTAERDALRTHGKRLATAYSQTHTTNAELHASNTRLREQLAASEAARELSDSLSNKIAAAAIISRIYTDGDISAVRATALADQFGLTAFFRYDGWPGVPEVLRSAPSSPLLFEPPTTTIPADPPAKRPRRASAIHNTKY
jgi:hypothetical protein